MKDEWQKMEQVERKIINKVRTLRSKVMELCNKEVGIAFHHRTEETIGVRHIRIEYEIDLNPCPLGSKFDIFYLYDKTMKVCGRVYSGNFTYGEAQLAADAMKEIELFIIKDFTENILPLIPHQIFEITA